MRLLERGHTSLAGARVSGPRPTCSGRAPRALALGQAAPAFVALGFAALLTVIIAVVEVWFHKLVRFLLLLLLLLVN